VKALAEIAVPSPGEARPGTLRREELEAFAALLGHLGRHQSVLVTGIEKGRRACAVGLATAAAIAGRRTALLECDLANPALAKRLDLSGAPGLHEYLLCEAEAQQILQPLVLAGPESGRATDPLVCIPAGKPATQAASSLLESESFAHASSKLRAAYELLVLDGPSLDADPGQLEPVAAAADALVVCVDRRHATRRSARRLKRRLRGLPTRFAGLVACD